MINSVQLIKVAVAGLGEYFNTHHNPSLPESGEKAMTIQDKVTEIGERLLVSLQVEDRHASQEAFATFIAVILSQNTTEANSSRAYERLSERFDVKPEVLAKAKQEDIKPLIKVAGLQERRSKRIIEVSREILERFNGDINTVFYLPQDEARKSLMSIKGVGPKTADVLLASKAGMPVLPIDTNIFRVANRLGLVKGRHYEQVRAILESGISKENRWAVHLSLIRLGREICRPRRPLHSVCPIRQLCETGLKLL